MEDDCCLEVNFCAIDSMLFLFFFSPHRCGKMAKRIAEKELTDRNWDQEDEAEEVRYTLDPAPTPPLQAVG